MRYVRSLLMPLPEARLVAVCRRDRAQGAALAGEHRLRYHPDYRDLIADREVQAVIVVTPPNLTRSICLEAVKWNKPILIEKPLATNDEDARAMVTAAGSAGLPLMTAHTVRYEAAVTALREKLPSVGDRRYLVLSNRVEPHPDLMSERSNYGGRGVLLETGIHLLDLLRFLTGEEALEVSCHMERQAPDVPEHRALAHIRLSGGFSCVVDSSRVTGGRVSRAEWIGEKGQVAADWIHHRVWRITSRDVLEEWRVENRPTVTTVLQAFFQALTHETAMPVTGLDGLRAVELADACYRSDEQGGSWIRMPLDG
jgi:predicted dehydrogenase